MEDKVYTRAELRQMIAPLLEKYEMESASIFGSYARNEAHGNSDIDLLLTAKKRTSPLNVFGVAEELHRISGKCVDVYEIQEINDGEFRNKILAEAVTL